MANSRGVEAVTEIDGRRVGVTVRSQVHCDHPVSEPVSDRDRGDKRTPLYLAGVYDAS
ncbi:MAG: hypothetical protein ACQETI_03385 [Halobacteriota archaeon]